MTPVIHRYDMTPCMAAVVLSRFYCILRKVLNLLGIAVELVTLCIYTCICLFFFFFFFFFFESAQDV